MKLLKSFGKNAVLIVLSWQVRRLQRGNNIKTVGVVGSYGKTSTKFAVARVLQKHFRVQFQEGNYNDIVSVPLVFFGETMPSILNPIAWLLIFIRNELQLLKPYPYNIVVLELGTDGPGQIAAFKRYLQLDVGVVTAIGDEHMEFFADLKAVADEELAVGQFSKKLVLNSDLCDGQYIKQLNAKTLVTFGYKQPTDYRLSNLKFKGNSYDFNVIKGGSVLLNGTYQGVAKAQVFSACAATVVGDLLGMPTSKIVDGIAELRPISGRMQSLNGIKGVTILDETYNASPDATKAALDVLYGMNAPQKIALLGNMNELGKYSKNAHLDVGSYCDPKQLDLVITLGPDANSYLAKAAREKGCTVVEFTNPHDAGEYLKTHLHERAIILAKGSQNGVFAEEAIKVILADTNDATKLVRQSKAWLKKKVSLLNAD